MAARIIIGVKKTDINLEELMQDNSYGQGHYM